MEIAIVIAVGVALAAAVMFGTKRKKKSGD